MRSSRILLAFLVTSSLLFEQALAVNPIHVNYSIRATPSDSQSDVRYVISLSLEAAEVTNDAINWSVQEFVIIKRGMGQADDQVWGEYLPLLGTADGLWWVNHADPSNPKAEEFHSTPLMIGTAFAYDPTDDDIDYDFQGIECAPPSGEPVPYEGRASSLTYSLTLTEQTVPLQEGEEEPVEVDPPDDEPSYAQD